MKKTWVRRVMTSALAVTLMAANVAPSFAKAAPDGKTDAGQLASAMQISQMWSKWQKDWDTTVKNDWTQISLTPGSNASELNFAWYSKKNVSASETDAMAQRVAELDAEAAKSKAPALIIGEGRSMRNAKVYEASQTEVKNETDKDGNTYYSNKVTAVGLKENTTYYYSYEQEDGTYTKAQEYTTQSTDDFSFIFVGDPQIGSSNELKGAATEEFYNAQSESVRSDAFNWAQTLNSAMDKTNGEASFVVSAGDQIQTTKKKAPNKDAANSEVEYSGYLSPEILKSLPVATSVGNHDADNANYTYHFNTPNNSELGTNGVVGGDYWFSYGDALFMMLNTQDTNVAEHKQFIEQAIAANKNCKWRIVTLHQDIYGSAEHSNEPEIATLRYQLVPYFEANDIDVVLTGHDHAYSRSKMILNGVEKTVDYTDDEFDEQLEKDMNAGENPTTLTTAPGNIQDTTSDPEEQKYLNYLKSIMDADAVETVKTENDAVINPDGILYMTANSSSGSKYYDLVPRMQTYIESRWQEDVPTYSVVDVDGETLTINTYRTDTNEKIDASFTIAKVKVDKSGLQSLIDSVKKSEVTKKNNYTEDSYKVLEQALNGAETVVNDEKATNSEVEAAIKALTAAKSSLNKVKMNISKASVSEISDKVYTGKNIVPSVSVKMNGVTLKKGTDYTVKYANNKYTGKATVTIQGQGTYTGSKTVTFKIVPKKVSLQSVKATGNKKVKVKVKKASGKVTGYQIKYATNSKFKNAKIKNTSKTEYTLSSLSSRKTYYVKVRAYKTVSGKKICGAYSKTMKVRVK